MGGKGRRTMEDYRGTTTYGLMDVVPSWLLVKFNTTLFGQLTMEGMLFLAPGGMSTRRSGLRLFIPRFTGGGDLACMLLFIPPEDTRSPGELRWFPQPFPNGRQKGRGKGVRRNRAKLSTSNFHHATQFKHASFHSLACTRMHHFQRHLL